MIERKEIDGDNLFYNLSHGISNHKPRKRYEDDSNRRSSFSKVNIKKENGIVEGIQYDHDAHVRYIQHWAKQVGLENHISVELQTEKIFLPELSVDYFTKYKITISKLKIMVNGMNGSYLYLNHLSIDEFYPIGSKRGNDKYSGGYYLVFKDNEFISKDKNVNAYLHVQSGIDGYLSFDNNIFDDVDLYCMTKYSTQGNVSILELKNNIFDNRHTTVIGNSTFVHKPNHNYRWNYNGSKLDSKIINKLEHKDNLEECFNQDGFSKIAKELKEKISAEKDISLKDILEFLLANEDRIKINPHDTFIEKSNSIIRISDNKIPVLKFGGDAWFDFRGCNHIDSISSWDSSLGVFWGAYQKIDPEGKHAHKNKEVFATLKQKATENNNVAQELILKREIIKCDYAFARQEKFKDSFQDRFIYRFSYLISNYGVSWLRPIIGLLIVNFLLCLILYFLYFFKPDSLESTDTLILIYFEMLNPTSHIGKNLWVESWFISLINIIQKAFYATVIYEVIKILRRF